MTRANAAPTMAVRRYPTARQGSTVATLHGVPIADPYRWLEDPDSAETRAFVADQTAFARDYLDAIPGRDLIEQRLTELWHYDTVGVPRKRGGRYFTWHKRGLQNQPVLMVQASLDDEPTLVLDPNTMSEDGTVAVTGVSFSRDGLQMAYTITRGGSDWQELHVRPVDSAATEPDVLEHVRHPGVAWHPDGHGFFYNGYAASDDRLSADATQNNTLYWHTVGSSQSEDRLIYARPDAPTYNFPPTITDDGQFLVLYVWHAAINRNRLYIRRLDDEDGAFIRLFDEADAHYLYLGNDESTLYVQTDHSAERGRIIAVDLDAPDQWRTVVPEQDDTLDFARIVNDQFVLVYLHDAHHLIRLADLSGAWSGEIALPRIGSVLQLGGKRADETLFVSYHSFLQPPSVLRHEFATGETTLFYRPDLPFDFDAYETVQRFAPSPDGTQIPLFITWKKGTALTGDNPTYLYAYGGYSINLSPRFAPSRLAFLEQGGVYVQACLRGGAEYGEAWHRAGMLENKQNVFDDFIASAEYLIRERVTRPDRLAIGGGSNGGLLVAACMVQRPDLYGAVLCHVPVIDMLRYHLFTAGRYWVPEYGDPANSEHFEFLIAYSPLHNVEDGISYPPTLIFTADKDDRVVPMHAHKFAARLQSADTGDNPILLRFETDAGHGFGKSTAKQIAEAADEFAFVAHVLGA